jgi:hypothetical protein
MIKKIACFFVFAWAFLFLSAQMVTQHAGPAYKLYLHTDREYYLPGDTLWFAPYVLAAEDHTLLAEGVNIHAELINTEGRIAEKRSFILEHGICSGWMSIEADPGNYVLRAYTDPMRLWDESTFFRKTIHVGFVSRKEEAKQAGYVQEKARTVDLFPEGGFLMDGRRGKVAFVARDRRGRRTDLDGFLQSEDGVRIPMKTTWKGAGSFLFTPRQGQKYKIVTTQGENIRFTMPEIRSRGARIALLHTNSRAVSFVVEQSSLTEIEDMYVMLFHRGKARSYIQVSTDHQEHTVSIATTHFGLGINRVVLLNRNYEPVSERLVFINESIEEAEISIDVENRDYTTRDRINLQLDIPLQHITDPVEDWARVSVAVINDNMAGVLGNNLDIRSWLLLDSELKGQVQNPGSYFIDDSITSAQKLDLLMLTNGWRDYLWNDRIRAEADQPDYDRSSHDGTPGYTITGKVTRNFLDRPFPNAQVILNVAGCEIQTTGTGKDGLFRFDSVVFFGPSLLLLQSMDQKGYSDRTRLQLFPFEHKPHPVEKGQYLLTEDIGSQSWRSYRRQSGESALPFELYLEEDTRILKEIYIVAEQPADPDPHAHKRIYGQPSQSQKVSLRETHYRNIFEYLEGRFAGVMVTDGNKVLIRGAGSMNASIEALFLLDGMFVEKEIIGTIPMHDVDLVEIIKGPETAIFGVRGANGVVSILTRSDAYDVTPKEIPGLVAQKVEGFDHTRIFYSPDYSQEDFYPSDTQDAEPDHRRTLYWNPLVLLDNDPTTVSFYACDQLARYLVFVEGITTTGKICRGTTGFTVTQRRD